MRERISDLQLEIQALSERIELRQGLLVQTRQRNARRGIVNQPERTLAVIEQEINAIAQQIDHSDYAGELHLDPQTMTDHTSITGDLSVRDDISALQRQYGSLCDEASMLRSEQDIDRLSLRLATARAELDTLLAQEASTPESQPQGSVSDGAASDRTGRHARVFARAILSAPNPANINHQREMERVSSEDAARAATPHGQAQTAVDDGSDSDDDSQWTTIFQRITSGR